MNGHIIGFHLQTQKVESPYKPPSNTLPVKRVKVSTLEFGHGDGTRVALVWALGLTVHTVFVRSGAVHCCVLAAKVMFQNGL